MTRRRITIAYTAVERDDLPTLETFYSLPGCEVDEPASPVRRTAVAVDFFEPGSGPHTALCLLASSPGFIVLGPRFTVLSPELLGPMVLVRALGPTVLLPPHPYLDALAELLDRMDRADAWRPMRVHLSWIAAMEHVSFEALSAVWNAVCPKTTTSYLDIDGVRATPIGPDWQPDYPMHVRDHEPTARCAAETPAGFTPTVGTMFDMLRRREKGTTT